MSIIMLCKDKYSGNNSLRHKLVPLGTNLTNTTPLLWKVCSIICIWNFMKAPRHCSPKASAQTSTNCAVSILRLHLLINNAASEADGNRNGDSTVMMTSSNGNIFRVTGPLCREFTGHRWIPRTVTRSFDVYFDPRLNKRLSKQSWGWWFETPSCSLWRHCNV